MYSNNRQKYLDLFNENRNEEKIFLEDLNCIFNYTDKLKSIVNSYGNRKQNVDGIN